MVFIETPIFSQQVNELLSADEFELLENVLGDQPAIGNVIPRSGGLRKMRWAAKGHGKRGGARVIYYWAVSDEQILLLFIYSKNEREDLTTEQIKILKKFVQEEYP